MTLEEQNEEVQNYFKSIGEKDPYLNITGFFNRTVSMIKKYGVDMTCNIYDLDKNIIKTINLFKKTK